MCICICVSVSVCLFLSTLYECQGLNLGYQAYIVVVPFPDEPKSGPSKILVFDLPVYIEEGKFQIWSKC